MRAIFVSITLASQIRVGVAQTHLYVDSSRLASGTGASWSDAFKTLGEAILLANATSASNFEIHLARGTYYPTGIQNGTQRDSAFVIRRGGVKLYGGYPSGGGLRNAALNHSVLSGAINAPADSTDNSYHVVVIAGISATADSVLMDGLTVTSGTANGTDSMLYNGQYIRRDVGGGVAISGVAGMCRIANCRITQNAAVRGGGMFLRAAAVRVSACVFATNRAAAAGGAVNIASHTPGSGALFMGNSFSQNTSLEGGGVAVTLRSQDAVAPKFVNNVFQSNSATAGSGGGLRIHLFGTPASDTLIGCQFLANTATVGGGAAVINDPTTGIIPNQWIVFNACTFGANTASGTDNGGGGGGLHFSGRLDSLAVLNCNFTGNKATVSHGGGIFRTTNGWTTYTLIKGSTFHADSAGGHGGGVYFSGYFGKVDSCFFTQNVAVNAGGGFYTNGRISFHNSAWRGNIAGYGGGAASIQPVPWGGPNLWRNCLFTGNKSNNNGGGLALEFASDTLQNVTFAGNQANSAKAVAIISSVPTFTNCIIWNGLDWRYPSCASNCIPVLSHCQVEGGQSGLNNSHVDPRFVAPQPISAAPTTAGNYTLQPCSPAINTGTALNVSAANPTDLAGAPRLFGPALDKGAYEAQFPAPEVVGNIAGPATLCTGTSSAFSNTPAGGTWTNSNPSVATVNATTGTVTGVTPGIDTIRYTYAGSVCTTNAVKIVQVLASPTPAHVFGDTATCAGATKQLSTTGTGGFWSSSDPSIASVSAAGVVMGNVAGTVTIGYVTTAANGCSSVAPRAFQVWPRYRDTVVANICAGAFYSFGPLTLNMPGTYTLPYQTVRGCDSTRTVVLTVSPTMAVTQTGNTLAAQQSGAVYQWVNCPGNVPIGGATAQSFSPTSPGLYAVIITLAGCTQTSACYNFTPSSVPETATKSFADVFPNPATDDVIIRLAEGIRAQDITVSETTGRTIARIRPEADTETRIPLSGYSAGLYFLQVQLADGRKQTLAVLKQ